MKKLFLSTLRVVLYPFSMLYPEHISHKISNLWHHIYAAFIRNRFKVAGNINIAGLPLHLHGGKYIELGDNVEFGAHARICAVGNFANMQSFTPQLKIGNNVVIQTLCHIGCINKVVIGDYTTMGARVYITDHTHGTSELKDLLIPPRKRDLVSKGPVIIGKNVHIGENSCIMPGVTIGDYCIIGANSVVTRDIPMGCIVAGVPAKILKQYSQEEIESLKSK